MYLETKRLIIREFHEADADVLYRIKTDKQVLEYELGWMMLGEYTGNGYAAEAAEYFCEKYGVDYLIAVMDVDNPASFHTAQKAGFKLFEKRTVYDYSCNRYCDDYYYFRRYFSKCILEAKFYGDVSYEGRVVKDGKE